MDVIVVVMHLLNGSVAEATVSITAPKMLCQDAFQKIAVFDTAKSEVRYKGKRVLLNYCKDKNGKFVR
ncbi:hypothetical protein [uncultured Mediterranean phage uvMED]|jgi:hypothetical protein|nr:hypothetical protein [uncultured Mediterranean phage uvMED]|tara:strand:+ start:84 stop:287 length:204 start_codon:yes stop_codon:yes gene_type:complete